VFACVAVGLLIVGQVKPLNPIALALACGTILALIGRMAVTGAAGSACAGGARSC
jgi:hypothetical protein